MPWRPPWGPGKDFYIVLRAQEYDKRDKVMRVITTDYTDSPKAYQAISLQAVEQSSGMIRIESTKRLSALIKFKSLIAVLHIHNSPEVGFNLDETRIVCPRCGLPWCDRERWERST